MNRILAILFCYCFSIASFADTTIIVITSGIDYTGQTWRYTGVGKPLDEPTIQKYWNEDKYITSIAYTSHGWFFAMNQGVKWTDQSYRKSNSWPDSFVQEKKNAGYMITSLASSDTQWVVVVSKNTDMTDQQVCSAPWSNLKDWIKQWWDKNYYITSIACQSGLWTVVMSKTTRYTAQSYMWANTADDIAKKIKEYWDKGYLISSLEYGGGEFFCIMSKTEKSASTGQSRFIKASEDPTSFIKEGWDKGWNITYIGG